MVLCTERSLVKHDRSQIEVKPLRCKCWGCSHCVHQRRRDLWHKAVNGKPRIFLTLTMRPTEGVTKDQQAQALVAHFRMLRQFLMRKLKRRSPTFLAVVEAHESGWPHLHVLVRSGFIDHRLIRSWWEKQTGSYQIDIRLAKGQRQVASYVSKYISKNPARFEHVKRYWCSQDWDPPKKEPEQTSNDEFTWWESITLNPVNIVRCALGDGARVTAYHNRWVINDWAALDRMRWGLG
jgi:hypothetical protein